MDLPDGARALSLTPGESIIISQLMINPMKNESAVTDCRQNREREVKTG